ncbi:hypothetical protein N656DRAFT_450250 [Canariomyces notabilis]|uniref:Uncharacterized protein n=1 Tax=Canariomyces notabilis TaxID=2074819 RepID=A0AAN6T8R4_9PEZI|nr:hypothetical protein N656DRAFT_450250 [Canariomyces arenarius]
MTAKSGHEHPHCRMTKSTTELEPADTEPRLRPQSLCDVASSRGVDPQLRSASCRLAQHPDHHDDSDPASDGERHPLVPEDREQDDDGTPALQNRRAASRSTSEKTMQQQSNLALATEASPVKSGGIVTPGTGATRRKHASFGRDVKQGSGTTRASTTELPDVKKVDLQQNPGRYRRRRHCDTDGKEECFLSVESGVKQGKDGDVIQLPQGKRRKARLRKNSLSLQAQQPPPTQGPKRRQRQHRNSRPQSSGVSTLEEGALEADFASFEEWPLEAVLKRVRVGGAATFQVEFTWNLCTNHGTNPWPI